MSPRRRCFRARATRPITLLFAALAACGGADPQEPQGPESARSEAARPNVIVYLVDTLRADHLGCYGYSRPTSPHVDAFAEETVFFEDATTQSSWTKPSVGSLFTGLLPTNHGAERREHALREGVPTLAATLGAAGYASCAIVTNPNVLPVFGFDAGFDEFIDVESVKRSARAERVHEIALDWLDRRPADSPFFLYVHARDPHAPYEPPSPHLERFRPKQLPEHPRDKAAAVNMGLYDGEIAYWDEHMGRFFEALETRELYDPSVIVLLSDHGEEFMEHGRSGHGETLFREQLHVPLMVRFPGGQPFGRVATPVRIVDIAPTLCDLLGIPFPDADGGSFLGLATGQPQDAEPLGSASVGYDPLLYAELNHGQHIISSLRSGRYKYISRRALGKEPAKRWLFDLEQDPGEAVDLTAQQLDIAEQLGEQLSEIESSLHHGLYLEIHNALPADGPPNVGHDLTGWIVLTSGAIEEFETRDLEDGDKVVLSADRRRIELELHLENRANPTRKVPPIIRDVDRLRMTLSDPAAKVELDLRLDGQPLEAHNMVLGETPYLGAYPLGVRADSQRLYLATGHAPVGNARADWAFCRLFAIAQPKAKEVALDDDLEKRLIELGYTGD